MLHAGDGTHEPAAQKRPRQVDPGQQAGQQGREGLDVLLAVVEQRLPLFERGVLNERVPLRARSTLYTRLGDWLAYLSLIVSASALGFALSRRSPRACSAS